jgi:hypothetical protein
MPAYIATTADDRYGLTERDAVDRYHRLYRIVGPEPADWDDCDGLVPWGDYEVGFVSHVDNIESAAIAADEEMAYLLADAKAEFGY